MAGVVVQHQPYRFAAMGQQLLQRLSAGQCWDALGQFGGEKGEQLLRRQRLAGEVEPDDQCRFGLGTEEFVDQHALAKAGRGAKQPKLGVLGGETFNQSRTWDMGRRQAWQARREDVRCLAVTGHEAVLAELLLWVNRTLAD
jgi:hypothetical protein